MPLQCHPLKYENRREHHRFQEGPRKIWEEYFLYSNKFVIQQIGQVSVRKGLSIIDNSRWATFWSKTRNLYVKRPLVRI